MNIKQLTDDIRSTLKQMEEIPDKLEINNVSLGDDVIDMELTEDHNCDVNVNIITNGQSSFSIPIPRDIFVELIKNHAGKVIRGEI